MDEADVQTKPDLLAEVEELLRTGDDDMSDGFAFRQIVVMSLLKSMTQTECMVTIIDLLAVAVDTIEHHMARADAEEQVVRLLREQVQRRRITGARARRGGTA